MRRTVLTIQHYARVFDEALQNGGWGYALRRTAGFIGNRGRSSLDRIARLVGFGGAKQRAKAPVSPFAPIIETLGSPRADRPLLLIISNCTIRQCVHYRIEQKLRYLRQIGLKAMHLSPAESGRLRAFLGLAHTVIIYRTALDDDLIQTIRETGARMIFEFDDLVVGGPVITASGILDQVTEHQAAGLVKQAEQFLKTAAECDGLIVSTPYLADLYARPENGLADLPSLVIPNFVESETYLPARDKQVTFAFTSPSGSIQDELAMLTGFLTSHDRATTRDWSILVMGNPLAQRALAKLPFKRGKVIAQPFSDFDEYLRTIARAETVLIPLSDSSFNRSKTAIRLMDAAVAGTQVVFCPVGAYESIRDVLADDRLCVPTDQWDEAGASIAPLLDDLQQNLADLQQAVRRVYGVEAARACYREVFLDRLALADHLSAGLAVAS